MASDCNAQFDGWFNDFTHYNYESGGTSICEHPRSPIRSIELLIHRNVFASGFGPIGGVRRTAEAIWDEYGDNGGNNGN